MYRFKNEYRLFTIVRYNYGYYNTLSTVYFYSSSLPTVIKKRFAPLFAATKCKCTREKRRHADRQCVGNLVLPYYSIVYLYSILNLPCIMIGYINIE